MNVLDKWDQVIYLWPGGATILSPPLPLKPPCDYFDIPTPFLLVGRLILDLNSSTTRFGLSKSSRIKFSLKKYRHAQGRSRSQDQAYTISHDQGRGLLVLIQDVLRYEFCHSCRQGSTFKPSADAKFNLIAVVAELITV